ncbi:MAG TPA: GNAT family N-acetyltransferase [Nocardioides sp.]|nr:GNAT family N-acetyltransferase [Nocardioides sp.]
MARAGDRPGVEQVIRAAFGAEGPGHGDEVVGLWRELDESGLVRISLVAVVDDEVVGHVGVSHAWLDARRALVDVLLLSPLSVLPAHQAHGIGTTLIKAAVAAGEQTGKPAMVLEGSPFYYGRRGFDRGSTHGIVAPSDRTPDAAFQAALFGSWEEWMTGRVVYPDVWWRHDAAGLRDPALAQLEEKFRDL